jgi:protein SCO1
VIFRRQILIAFLAWPLLLSFPSPAQTISATDTNHHVYQVKGVVKEVHPENKNVTVQHEAIVGYMPAMTMTFDVKNTNELRGLQPGDAIGFQMIVSDKDGWIEHITKNSTPHLLDPPSRPTFRLVRDVDPLNIGDPLPEYHFTNELGQAVSTKQFLGQPFAFTFFFTQCPYPAFCPLMSSNFKSVQNALLEMTNAPTHWHLISISFDTTVDTPATLKAYGRRYNYQPEHWSFVTGDLVEITAIADQVGAYFGHDEGGGITHNLRTVVVDARGRVQKIFNGNKWTTDELVAELVKAGTAKP